MIKIKIKMFKSMKLITFHKGTFKDARVNNIKQMISYQIKKKKKKLSKGNKLVKRIIFNHFKNI